MGHYITQSDSLWIARFSQFSQITSVLIQITLVGGNISFRKGIQSRFEGLGEEECFSSTDQSL